jgi:putative ABC transport system permease protein
MGIFESFNVYDNNAVLMPLPELQELMARSGHVTAFAVVADHARDQAAAVPAVLTAINDLCDEQGRSLGLLAQSSQEYVSTAPHMRLVDAMAWLTTVIAVVIGTIGVLNTMSMAVCERVREIGILRAMGWPKSRVVLMILGESFLLSLAGAVLGTVAAVLLTRWLTTFPQASGFVAGTIAPVIVAEGFLMAVLVGLVGGAYPAYHAARLLPTEALCHE